MPSTLYTSVGLLEPTVGTRVAVMSDTLTNSPLTVTLPSLTLPSAAVTAGAEVQRSRTLGEVLPDDMDAKLSSSVVKTIVQSSILKKNSSRSYCL